MALNHAGIAALTLDDSTPTRIVLAVDQDVSGGDELGAVTVAHLEWAEVRSLFADEAAAAAAVLSARSAVRGLDLAAALADPTVEELQESYDLLWYAPEELGRPGTLDLTDRMPPGSHGRSTGTRGSRRRMPPGSHGRCWPAVGGRAPDAAGKSRDG